MDIYVDIINQYKNLTNTTTTSQLEQCRLLAELKQRIIADSGSDRSKKYTRAVTLVTADLNIKKSQYKKDILVGEYLINNPTNIELYSMTKTGIYNTYINPPKPKEVKPKAIPAPGIDLNYYKDCERKYMALMDFMGEKADSILAKALSKKELDLK